uniref:Uncharacterized protein n=1 Tax=Desertifilum tharense IPPAS B-1220 TaxID=1781255 RepID=A0A1E5QK30_9CYAN|nr:hypothetical protein BH720_12070 [Desertifilum tharense IPPAS B-1220]
MTEAVIAYALFGMPPGLTTFSIRKISERIGNNCGSFSIRMLLVLPIGQSHRLEIDKRLLEF